MYGETQLVQMPQKRDDDSGQYREVYPPDIVIKAVRTLGQATTQQVADELGCAYQTAYLKLRELEDDNQIQSTRVGNVRLWSAKGEGE